MSGVLLGDGFGDAAPAAGGAGPAPPARRSGRPAEPAGGAHSGPMRRPQVGQSLRSFCESWSHQGQKRRFSTAHGSREGEGASGSTMPTTSSGSPVSRSQVDSSGLGLDEDLAAGGAVAQAVTLAGAHGGNSTERWAARLREPGRG